MAILPGELDVLHNFAVWMLGSREEAERRVTVVVDTNPGRDLDALLGQVCRGALGQPARARDSTERKLQKLDDLLRSDVTIPVTLDHPLVRGEARRLQVLQSEVKRACLWASVRALSPMPRSVFLLWSLYGRSHAQIAEICGSTIDRVEEAHRRAVQTLTRYLGVRCEHLDARNICHCDARIGLALEHAFIRWPDHDEHADATPSTRANPDLTALFAGLPWFRRRGRSLDESSG